MAKIFRDMGGDFTMKFRGFDVDPRTIVAKVEEEILKFLVKEFTEKHGQNILNAIHASTISHQISEAIADKIQKQFFKEKSE